MTNLRAPDTLEPDWGWRRDAACLEAGPDLFLAECGPQAREARAICATCPVAVQCLEAALAEEVGDHSHRAGIRGGLSPRQRSGLAKRQRLASGAPRPTGGKPPAPCGTAAAYERHKRHGEPIDDACREARNEKRRRERERRRTANAA